MIQRGSTLTFQNFTIHSLSKGRDLIVPARQLLQFAQQQGAKTLNFTGTFSNADLAARFGTKVGGTFHITIDATRQGIIEALRSLR